MLGIVGSAEASGPWHELDVPGGRIALARAAGLDGPLEPWQAITAVIHRVHLSADGSGALAAVQEHLRHASGRGATERAPLPLPPELWDRAVFGRSVPPEGLLAALLSDRDAALLYQGLMTLDEPTLAFLVDQTETLSTLRRRHAVAFAQFAAGLQIHEGHVAVPGGVAGTPLWEALVGQPVDKPADFLLALLERGDGRLAFFYDTIARLEPPSRDFALGLGVAPSKREERFRALWLSFARVEPWWDAGRARYIRPAVDPAAILLEVRCAAGGVLAAPAQRALWAGAFDGGPLAQLRSVDLDGPAADAAWLVEQVVQPASASPDRLSALAFGQRVFADAAPGADVAVALRAAVRYPALSMTLERIGIRDAGLYAAAARRAEQLSAPLTARHAVPVLAQFQGALALLDRARFSRSLDEEAARALAASLVAVEPLGPLRYDGRIARWLDQKLFPAVLPDGSVEEALDRALTGGRSPTPVEWNGGGYVVDIASSERERLRAARRRLERNTLEHVLDFCRSAAALRDAPLDAWPAYLAALEEAALGLEPAGLEDGGHPAGAATIVAEIRAALEAEPPRDPAALRRGAQPATAAGDLLLGEALVSLVYAAHLGPDSSVLLATGHVARRHDFGLGAASPDEGAREPWRLARDARQHPWRMRGSLLGLDAGLAPFALRRLSHEPPARAPALDPDERAAFARGVVLLSPFSATDDGRDALVDGLRRGRARVAEAGRDPAALDALAQEARLSRSRRNILAWLARAEPGALERYFTLSELSTLGTPARQGDWGLGAPALGALVPRTLPPRPWEDLRGSRGALAPRVPDLSLRIADALASRALPATLARPLLALAVQDLLDDAQPVAPDDGDALARFARELPSEKIDAYLDAIARDGTLRRLGVPIAPAGTRR
jgi:hypothetical protein